MGRSKRHAILVVDDSEDTREVLQRNLESEGYAVTTASGVPSALKILEATKVDLVITDVKMPEVGGLELVRHVRENLRDTEILVITGYPNVNGALEAMKNGAADYLTKPFNIKELRVRVKNLIKQRQKLRERFRKELLLEPREIAVTSADERFLKQTLDIIEKNMSDEDFSVEQLGSELAMSRMQLFRKIKALTDQAPSEFIRTIRLKRAALLIKSNFGNLAEITYEVGFNHPSYFAKCFRELFGVAPSEYTKT